MKGVDERAWVELMDAEYRDYASWWRGTTADDMRRIPILILKAALLLRSVESRWV